VVGRDVTEPFIRQEPHGFGDGGGRAVGLVRQDLQQFRWHAEDDAAATVQAAPGQQRAVIQHYRQRRDRYSERECLIVGTGMEMTDESIAKVNRAPPLIDMINIAFD